MLSGLRPPAEGGGHGYLQIHCPPPGRGARVEVEAVIAKNGLELPHCRQAVGPPHQRARDEVVEEGASRWGREHNDILPFEKQVCRGQFAAHEVDGVRGRLFRGVLLGGEAGHVHDGSEYLSRERHCGAMTQKGASR